MLRTLRRVPSVARIAFVSPRSAVRVSMVRLPLSALPTPQGSSTEEWSLIVALCRPRQGRQKANFCTEHWEASGDFYFLFLQEGDLVRWAPRSRFLHAHVRCAAAALSPKAPALPVLQVHLLNGHTAKSARMSRRNFRVVVPPRTFRSYVGPLGRFGALVFEHRLSAGTRVTSHHGILHDFHHQLLHPAPLMNSPSSSTCSHLLLVTSSHLDFPGGVMNRLSSPVGVLAP